MTSSASNQAGLFLYTHTLLDDIRVKVERIAGPEGFAKFRSGIFAVGSDADKGMQCWYEACTDDGVSFEVVRYDRVPGYNLKSETVLRQVCFFDALHYCGKYDGASVRDVSLLPVDDSDHLAMSIPHWRKAAEAAYQPLDRIGMPCPAAGGRILVNGDFDDDAYKRAVKTGSIKQISDKAFKAPLFDLPARIEPHTRDIAARVEQAAVSLKDKAVRDEVCRMLGEDVGGVSKLDTDSATAGRFLDRCKLRLCSALEHKLYSLVVSVVGGLIVGLVMGVVIAGVGAICGGLGLAMAGVVCVMGITTDDESTILAMTGAQRWLKKYNKLINKMPQPSRKYALCRDFAAAAEAAFILKDAHLYYEREMVKPSTNHQKLVGHILARVDRAASIGNLPPDQVSRLNVAYLENALPPVKTYENNLRTHAKQLMAELMGGALPSAEQPATVHPSMKGWPIDDIVEDPDHTGGKGQSLEYSKVPTPW